MNAEVFTFLRVVFTLCFFATALGGVFLLTKFHRFFGVDPQMPSETASARTYNRTQIVLVWVLALKLFAMAAILV